jgi:citrate synthase
MPDKKPSGLQDVVVAESSICFIDGQRGQLVYRGYDIDDLAHNSTFEEVAYLLWNGRLPQQAQLDALKSQLFQAMTLPPPVLETLGTLPKDADTMRVLQIGVAALGVFDPQGDDPSEEANRAKSVRLAAQLLLIATTWNRLRQGLPVLEPRHEYGLAWNFLYLMSGQEPDEYAARTFDVALILHADHELNASTFSARVTAATLSDMHSAVVSAIGTLKGPLHGGANEAVMKMLHEIGSVENARPFVENLIANKQKVMGFGHRVYKAKDPRAKILEGMSRELGERVGDTKWFEMSLAVEETFQPHVASKGIYPNVDFFSASAYHVMGIPDDLFTPIFACSRVVGWTAHLLEQYANNRIFRPDSDYIGEKGLKWQPIEARS